jgi:hypothetical protein
MQRLRLAATVLLGVATLGSLAATGGYAWYLRSDRYRRSCAEYLASCLELPSEIGRVVPRSRMQREFDDVVVWLPQRRGPALHTRRAIVAYTPTAADPDAYEIELIDGECEVSTRTWLRQDYRFMLESGLRPGFDPTGPRRVRFRGMDLSFERGPFRAALNDASGVVTFDSPEKGQALIRCTQFNGHRSASDIVLRATFSPKPHGIRLDRMELSAPRLPLAILGLAELVGVDLRTGSFQGALVYREEDDSRRLRIEGKLFDVRLAEPSAALAPRPWRGECPELELEELTAVNGVFDAVRFRGVLRGLHLGDALTAWGLGTVGGDLTLRVRAAEVAQGGIERLILSGKCENVSLESVSSALGWGRMSGTARIVIDDLTVQQNRLASLAAEIRVQPDGEPHWIESALLRELVRKTFGLSLPPVLPERIEYSDLGVRLDVRDEVLHVFGTHGDRDRTILTVVIGGAALPLLVEPGAPIDLHPQLDALREQAAAYVAERVRAVSAVRAWEALLRARESALRADPGPEVAAERRPLPTSSRPAVENGAADPPPR